MDISVLIAKLQGLFRLRGLTLYHNAQSIPALFRLLFFPVQFLMKGSSNLRSKIGLAQSNGWIVDMNPFFSQFQTIQFTRIIIYIDFE